MTVSPLLRLDLADFRNCAARLCTNLTSNESMTDAEFLNYLVDFSANVHGACFPHVEKALRCAYA